MLEEDSFYRDILDHLYDGVYSTNRERKIMYWSKDAERITGYTSHQVVGQSCRDNVLNHVDANGVQPCLNRCPLAACMEDGLPCEAEVFLHIPEEWGTGKSTGFGSPGLPLSYHCQNAPFRV